MTPYLAGLLVLLGMSGTFLGMAVTLNGAVMALESTTDLQAVRASLAAPVKGLGLAFGTSVARVPASATLGLLSALCRRERLQASQGLDSRIATVLRPFSLAHQRQQAYQSLQSRPKRCRPCWVNCRPRCCRWRGWPNSSRTWAPKCSATKTVFTAIPSLSARTWRLRSMPR